MDNDGIISLSDISLALKKSGSELFDEEIKENLECEMMDLKDADFEYFKNFMTNNYVNSEKDEIGDKDSVQKFVRKITINLQ